MQNFVFHEQIFTAQPQKNLSHGNDVFFAIGNDAVDVLVNVENMRDLAAVNIAFGRRNAKHFRE